MRPELVVRGGRLVDETGERTADIAIDDGRIVGVGPDLEGEHVVDASGCVVGPGFVDLGATLREPGFEEVETLAEMARDAVLGGYVVVVGTGDTVPVLDSVAAVREVRAAARTALCEIVPSATVTVGGRGETMSPLVELAAAGVRLFADPVPLDAAVFRRALDYSSHLRVRVAVRCEDASLAAGGVMNEGEWSARLGLPGRPAEAEEIAVMRDVAIARLAGSRLHLRTLSTAGSLAVVRAAKAGGIDLTFDVAAVHLALTDAECARYDPAVRWDPPLRSANDVDTLVGAVCAGDVDAVVSAHRAIPSDHKEWSFDDAPPGGRGLLTTVAVVHDAVSRNGRTIADVWGQLSWRPAAIAQLGPDHSGRIEAGRGANLTVVDPVERWRVPRRHPVPVGNDDPFADRELVGRVRHTIRDGRWIVRDGVIHG